MGGKRMLQVFLALTIGFSLASAVSANDPWALFGDARPARQGAGSNPWTIELSSQCPPANPDCLMDNTLTFGGIIFQAPSRQLTFADIHQLATSYKIQKGDCGGGSPRFTIGIDTNGDGEADGHVFVYAGPTPSFTGCTEGVWESTGNLITSTESRFEITQLVPFAPSLYMNHTDALGALGELADKPVVYVLLVVDGGWLADQVVLADNVKVNSFKLTAKGYVK
jgi:hypothetical protein